MCVDTYYDTLLRRSRRGAQIVRRCAFHNEGKNDVRMRANKNDHGTECSCDHRFAVKLGRVGLCGRDLPDTSP